MCYGVFCSHHNEAMSFYKEQLQNNKKMQLLMRVSKAARCHCHLWCLPEHVAARKWNRNSFFEIASFSQKRAMMSRREWQEQRSSLKTKPLFHGRK